MKTSTVKKYLRLNNRVDAFIRENELTKSGLEILVHLDQNPHSLAQELVNMIGIQRCWAYELLSDLKARNLVIRTGNKYSLTMEGMLMIASLDWKLKYVEGKTKKRPKGRLVFEDTEY
ncbi:MAG: hypothetical protein JXQ90_21675 [Cyclobacteriaceae bacterium]